MNAVTVAGVISTLMFLGSNLPMVVQAVRTRDVASYSRGYLVMTNIGNAVYTVYVLSLPAGPIWLLHLVYTTVSAFMLLLHVWWTPSGASGRGGVDEGMDDFEDFEDCEDVVVAGFTVLSTAACA